MKCPVCNENTPDIYWRPLSGVLIDGAGTQAFRVEPPDVIGSTVALDFIYCANPECKQLVIRVNETSHLPAHAVDDPQALTWTWLARPRIAPREIDPLVPEPLRTDYLEAAAILDASPRMSAVLSRSVLADVLEKYAGLDDFSLDTRVNTFRADTQHPSGLRAGMHHFREIADFGAHTQKKKHDQTQIIPVTREDAEWLLTFLDRLFDYFIVSPEKDRQMMGKWDANLADAGRKPIAPAPKKSPAPKKKGS